MASRGTQTPEHRRSKAPSTAAVVRRLETESHALTERLPELLIESARVAQTVIHGIHGRRKAGPGETFWQFRPFDHGDGQSRIDWRRSAASDHLYVREREWEAAHTVWLWADRSPSMVFRSALSETLKRDRALVLTFALAELLARGGERVGFLGATRPRFGRNTSQAIALALSAEETTGEAESLPPSDGLQRHADLILISDFLEPRDTLEARLNDLGSRGVNGHLVQIVDPAEETLPYRGRVVFEPLEGGDRVVAERVEGLRDAYQERFQAHRAVLEATARRFGWSFLVHHTDRPAREALLTLYARLSGRTQDGQTARQGTGFGAGLRVAAS